VVRDHGIGIPNDMREKVFEPFGRALSSRRYGGLGLGLFVARTILDGFGGTLRVESDPESGSAFVITLPRSRMG